MSVRLTISSHVTVPPGLIKALRTYLRSALAMMRLCHGAWSITLVDDAAMIDLHRRTMGLRSTTDVLTFDLFSGRPTGGKRSPATIQLDLDTVICVTQAKRRAKELGHPLLNEVLLYAIHSLLHVRGYNDQTPRQAKTMHEKEDAILTELGIGCVYNSLSHNG